MEDRAIGKPEVGPKALMKDFVSTEYYRGPKNVTLKKTHKANIMQEIYWGVGHAKMADYEWG